MINLNYQNNGINLFVCKKAGQCLANPNAYVDYVLGGLNNKIFASKYKLNLPTPKELAEEVKKDIPDKQ